MFSLPKNESELTEIFYFHYLYGVNMGSISDIDYDKKPIYM